MPLDELIATITSKEPRWRSNPLLDSQYVTTNVYKCKEKGTTVLYFEHNKSTYELGKYKNNDQSVLYSKLSLQRKFKLQPLFVKRHS